MPINYQVKQGDCISSIAFEHGFFADTIWNHPNNAELKKKRKDPNVLVPNDIVFVPDKRIKEVSEPTNQVHKFQLKNAPATFSVQLFDFMEEPRTNQSYELVIDDKLTRTGITSSEGILEVTLPPNAKRGVLTIGDDKEVVEFFFGFLEGTTEIRGIQARLQNLGFECPIDGKLNDETIEAIKGFQRRFELEVTGEADSATLTKLQEFHDGISEFPEDDPSKGGGISADDASDIENDELETEEEEI